MDQKFGVVILAAGATARRGRPKQLLPYLGRTLIEHATRTALASGADQVVVVVGSDAARVCKALTGLPIRIVLNQEWSEGLSSSIRFGIAALGDDFDCAVVALCDQPRITPELLRSLARRQFENQAQIVASSYDGVIGAPCAFSAELFPELLALHGDSGARDLIRTSLVPVETIEFTAGNVDVCDSAPLKRFIPSTRIESPREACRENRHARAPPRTSLRIAFPV